MMTKININDPTAWQSLDWSETVGPKIKSDDTVRRSNENRRRWQDPDWRAKQQQRIAELMASPEWAEIVARRAKTASLNADDEFRSLMSELSTTKWQDPEFRAKSLASRAEYWADPANHEERSAVMHEVMQRPEVKAAMQAGAQRRSKDPKDQALRKEVGARNKSNPKFSQACKNSVTPERIEKFKASTLKHKKPVTTPLGVFRCVSDAAQAHGVNNGCLRARIKKNDPNNYRYISIEEYIILTGKEL
jgi:hypothetical protein